MTDQTPRTDARCRYCAAVIEKRGRVWFHVHSGIPFCTDLAGVGHKGSPARGQGR